MDKSGLGDVSLVDGLIPLMIFVLAPVTILLSIGWTTGRWRRQLLWAVPISAAVVLVAAIVNENFKLIPYEFPFFFYLLLGIVVLAVVITVVGWLPHRYWQRVVGVIASVIAVLLLGVVVNRHYRYYPTANALLGQVAADEVSLPELDTIRDETARTGKLPSQGYTVNVPIPGTVSGFKARNAYVYLPPAWFATPTPELPVLVMVHGVPGGPENWSQAGKIDDVADPFAAAHDGKAPILVMPDISADENNDTECTDSPRGNSETYLAKDVPEFMRSTFSAASGTGSMGVAGFSVGGFCAVMLPLRHPDVYTTFGDYSGFSKPTLDPPGDALADVFGGNQSAFDAYDADKLLTEKQYPGLSGWFETGSEDPDPLEPTKAVVPLANAAGIQTCLLIRPGGHDFGFWEDAFRHSLPWLSWKLGLTPEPPPADGATCS